MIETKDAVERAERATHRYDKHGPKAEPFDEMGYLPAGAEYSRYQIRLGHRLGNVTASRGIVYNQEDFKETMPRHTHERIASDIVIDLAGCR